VGRGPEHLLERGAHEALASRGAAVSTEVLELEERHAGEADACFALIRLVAARIAETVRQGAFPVVLSGSCFVSVGIVAGLGERAPGVLWLDAHGDFNTPATTTEGYFDGMGLAVLTGSAWQGLLATVDGATPLPETAAVLAGARDFDPPERERLEASAVSWLPPGAIDSPEPVLRALDALSPAPSGICLHVDLDVLDAAVNVYSAPDGLSASRLEALVAAVLDEQPVRALSLTAYDPECDTKDRVPPIALRLLGLVARRLARPPA
jgi:arginase